MNERAKAILKFWFVQTSHKDRFTKNEAFDQIIRTNFFDDYQKGTKNKYDYWQKNADECVCVLEGKSI